MFNLGFNAGAHLGSKYSNKSNVLVLIGPSTSEGLAFFILLDKKTYTMQWIEKQAAVYANVDHNQV